MSYILCSDLDRTLIPNGQSPSNMHALPALHELIELIDLKIVYVSGRNIKMVNQAIATYSLPKPDIAITDVGSQIYEYSNNSWEENSDWHTRLLASWHNEKIAQLNVMLSALTELKTQETAKQSKFKLSYYCPNCSTQEHVLQVENKIKPLCQDLGLNVNIISSIDETSATGLLDILPGNASKLEAIQFIAEQNAYDIDKLVFAGDSGNDVSVLTSSFKSILVNNAQPSVKKWVEALSKTHNRSDRLFIARGDFLGLNGHYCSGILEGLNHYFPELNPIVNDLLKN